MLPNATWRSRIWCCNGPLGQRVCCLVFTDTPSLNDAAAEFLDEQLAKVRAGERSALAALIQVHQRSVYSLALRMLGTRDLAEI